jgi:ATP-dependent Clp protease ATP-binding subunit ClpA
MSGVRAIRRRYGGGFGRRVQIGATEKAELDAQHSVARVGHAARAMFERFTDQARQVVVLAQEEARLMRHGHIGTEHLLVALARVEDDVAAPMLHAHGLSGEKTRAEVVAIVGIGNTEPGGQLPFTPAAHDALEATLRESLELGHERVEPAHLLLGVVRQRDGVARRVLAGAGAHPVEVREEVERRMEQTARSGGRAEPDPGAPVPVRLGEELLGDLGNSQVDGKVLLRILERDGAVAAWLHERGVDEHAVRRMLGEP